MGRSFTGDVDYVKRGEGWWKSNKENVEGHQAIHDSLVKQKQKMTYRSTMAQISFLKPAGAIVGVAGARTLLSEPRGDGSHPLSRSISTNAPKAKTRSHLGAP